MSTTVVLRRFREVVLWPLIATLALGCSSEPSGPVPSPSPGVATTVSADEPADLSGGNIESLIDREFTLEEGFRKLSLDDFEFFFAKPLPGKQDTWVTLHDAIVCTGKPKGYLYSRETFADFTLRLELRFAPSAAGTSAEKFNPNTGVMLHITEPHKQWPKSLEVQGRFSDLATIKENGGEAKMVIIDDVAARESARKPVGEWNAIEILSKAGTVTARLNGTKVCESQPSDVTSGMIGLQSEDFEVHFRRLRIRAE